MKSTLFALQKYMQDQGFYTLKIDGDWGRGSINAMVETLKTKPRRKAVQEILKVDGFYIGDIDGAWGPLSENALKRAHGEIPRPSKIAWGKKVDDRFLNRVIAIADALDLPRGDGPSDLMSCMAWESGESFSPSIRNGAGSGATGLIQFMPATAKSLGTTTDKLAKMTAYDQLEYVYRYFRPYRGRLHNLGDIYMAILWPAGVGKSDNWVLWDSKSRPTTYRQNIGLDVNKDGVITRGECLFKVQEKKTRGLTTTWAR